MDATRALSPRTLHRLRPHLCTATVACTLLLLLVNGCLTGTSPTDPATTKIPPAAKVDDLLIVDCLLPGQIRQLGREVTYVTRRQPVKTSARNCEIRGGEYVAFDRANYATALKIWLPPAQQGDPAAQTYVGEIFEKGLGVTPDYGAAAEWYRRAAERNYARAAINLANLYEQGLGVPQDKKEALNWYRRAAGLPGLTFEPLPPGEEGPELRRLRKVVDQLQRTLQEKQSELEDLRRQLGRRRSEVGSERVALERERRELEERRRREERATAELQALERSIKEREARLAEKKGEEANLVTSLVQLEVKHREQQVELDRLRELLAGAGPDIHLIEPRLAALRGERGIQVALATEPAKLVPVKGRVESVGGLRSLTINAREEKLQGGNLFETQLQVKNREQQVRIVAIDGAGRKATLEFYIRSEPAGGAAAHKAVGFTLSERDFGNYHALVIGNDNYGVRFTRLQTAVSDATAVAQILRELYGFKVTLLINASRYEILTELNKLRERLTEKDNLLVYYAGHGKVDPINQRGHWLPVDAEPKSSANWIPNDAITDIFNAMSVRQLLVVADTCYAGTLTRSGVGQLEAGISEEKRVKLIQLMAQKRSRMVMTSGGVQPVLDGVGGKHSAFAQPFINLLRANVGVLPGQELFQILQLPVTAAAQRVRTWQAPEYAPIKHAGHESGDFIFVRIN